ncbi:hypothetical protein DOTSEDRAFT_85387 [Dothistroma septosporum NZE10]|uniref:Uncharacterized protein n=1 Tax=Dothistroma septosporum (strain NZE10 / CBS 128990) TaxID=675120 RepID=N1Q3A5_DOTSN|nr:hypothetical protein DOTSEDRAFT_85387 [Dothistroma septosporum NZE10]
MSDFKESCRFLVSDVAGRKGAWSGLQYSRDDGLSRSQISWIVGLVYVLIDMSGKHDYFLSSVDVACRKEQSK